MHHKFESGVPSPGQLEVSFSSSSKSEIKREICQILQPTSCDADGRQSKTMRCSNRYGNTGKMEKEKGRIQVGVGKGVQVSVKRVVPVPTVPSTSEWIRMQPLRPVGFEEGIVRIQDLSLRHARKITWNRAEDTLDGSVRIQASVLQILARRRNTE
jgi:hypothetical protein